MNMMKPYNFLICHILFVLLCNSSIWLLVTSQDSCTSSNNDLDRNVIKFDTTSLRCIPVWEPHNFILRYGQASSSLWSFVLSYPTKISSYAAMGFSGDGNMVGSSAMVMWVESEDDKIFEYYLGGTSEDKVIHNSGDLPWTNASGYYHSSTSTAYLAFQLHTINDPLPFIIFAIGPQNSFPSAPNYLLSLHSDKISLKIDYDSGKIKVISNLKLKRSHGWLNIVGWSGLMIIGAIIGRHFQQWDPIWFYLHILIQTIGFIGGLAGIICGFYLSKKVSTNVTLHKNIGIFILVLGFLQVMAFVVRPGKESKLRKYWNYYHHNVGRMVIIFALSNTFYGLHLGDESSKWFLGYGIAIAILIILAIVLEIRMLIVKKKSKNMPS